jgi:hypothetical protein
VSSLDGGGMGMSLLQRRPRLGWAGDRARRSSPAALSSDDRHALF